MVAMNILNDNERLDFLKWVSERNSDISMDMLLFLLDLPDLPDESFDDDDESWDFESLSRSL